MHGQTVDDVMELLNAASEARRIAYDNLRGEHEPEDWPAHLERLHDAFEGLEEAFRLYIELSWGSLLQRGENTT